MNVNFRSGRAGARNGETHRTWIEIDARAARHNCGVFRRLAGSHGAGAPAAPRGSASRAGTKLLAVVKSNAYGHGLPLFPKVLDRAGVDGFCVDSAVEAFTLRRAGITKPILVLGLTLPARLAEAADARLAVTISNIAALRALKKNGSAIPDFHVKIDTGMHRQGFYPEAAAAVFKEINASHKLRAHCIGIYTHFSSAKDVNYPTYTEMQFANFMRALAAARKAGFKHLMRHAAATGGAITNTKYHLDAIRIGIGLCGVYPSRELEIQLPELGLRPALSWRTVVGEVKRVKKGSYIGYDMAERMPRDGTLAILPVGYWHGVPRAASHAGSVLVRGRRAKIMGKVSMDLIAAHVTGIPVRVGDVVTLIGRDHKEEISAYDAAGAAGTTPYEFLTRINPLIERVRT